VDTATQTLHRLTSYAEFDEETVWEPPVADPRVVDFASNDVDRLPYFYKHYADGLPTVALPRDLPRTSAGTVEVVAGRATVPAGELDLAQLGRLLHLCAGVVRTSTRRYGDHLFRAAGSAGGRFPLELYVAIPDGAALPAGVHWYHPQEHALVQVAPAPAGGAPAVIVTGVPWRTGWRYRERGYRHVYWDAGTMLSQLLAAAASAGVATSLYSRFPDAAVTELVGADGTHEWPVAVVGLGGEDPAITAAGAAVRGEVDRAPMELPLVTAAQHAGDTDTLGNRWPAGSPVDVALPDSRPVEDVVLSRGSQRLLDPEGVLPAEMLRTSLAAALRGIDVPHWVAVHNIDGVGRGIYRCDDLEHAVRDGDVREAMYRASMDQGLGRDASFVAVAATDLSALDDHGYREAHLAAGLVEGRLHLLAYAQGAAASGMTFVDGLVPSLLRADVNPLLFTCVGVPEYTSKPGGMPGAPTAVSMITPRT
jgi:hypothetical protein